MRRHMLIIGVFTIAPIVFGCGNERASTLLVAVGLADSTSAAAERIGILCDPSEGSTCTLTRLDATFDAALNHVAARPGSIVELFGVGSEVADTHLLYSDTVTLVAPARKQDADIRRTEHVATSRSAFHHAAEEFLKATPTRRSPLAESLTKIGSFSTFDHV